MKSVEGKTVRDVSAVVPRHSSHTLSTAHASRTHVKAPQTDFPVKPDNSLGPTHGSPSKRPSRTKVTFQHKKHRKASRPPSSETPAQAKHGPTPPHAPPGRRSGPRPEGQRRDQAYGILNAQSHGRSFEDIRSVPMAPLRTYRSLQGLVSGIGFRDLSLWKERLYLSFSLYISIYLSLSTYPYRAISMSSHFEVQLTIILRTAHPHFECRVPSF